MTLPIAPLPGAECTAAAESRSAGRHAWPQAPSPDTSQAWADALAQATASPAGNLATRARTAITIGDQSAGLDHASAPATTAPPGAATETPKAASKNGMAQAKGFDDLTAALAEPTLASRPQILADAVATAATLEQNQGTTGAAATQAGAARLALSARPDRHKSTQGSSGSETTSTAATRSPPEASGAARSSQSVAWHKDERRHHMQQANTQAPVGSASLSASLSAGMSAGLGAGLGASLGASLGAGVPEIATAAPLRPDPAPSAALPPPSNGPVAAAAPSQISAGSSLQAITTLAKTATDAAVGSGTGHPSMNIPTPAATALAQDAASAPTAPDIARAPLAVSHSLPAPMAAAALAPAPANVRNTATPSAVPAGADTHPAMPATAVIGTPSGDPQDGTAASASVTPSQVATSTQVATSHLRRTSSTPAIAFRTEAAAPAAAPAGLPDARSPLVDQTAGRPDVTNDAGRADSTQAVQARAARTPVGSGAAISLAAPQSAGPGDGTSPAIDHDLFGGGSAPAAVTGSSPAPLAAAAGVVGSPQSPGPSSAAGLSQPPLPGQAPAVPATATALAAAVVAMSQSGQSTAVLRLDPPGLGSLSIHIALTANATVNVVFVPSVLQTAQLIHSALPDLHHAMTGAGLSLGEAQVGVGGGGGGNPNGQARNQTGDGNRVAQTTMLSRTASEADSAPEKDALHGARAVA